MTARIDAYVQDLWDAVPHKVSDLVKECFPEEPGVYMFTEGNEVMYIGSAAQGIRTRVFQHHLASGQACYLPILKRGPNAGTTRQEGGNNLVYHLTLDQVDKPLDMNRKDHKSAWLSAVARVRKMDLRWVVLPQLGVEKAAKKRFDQRYGK